MVAGENWIHWLRTWTNLYKRKYIYPTHAASRFLWCLYIARKRLRARKGCQAAVTTIYTMKKVITSELDCIYCTVQCTCMQAYVALLFQCESEYATLISSLLPIFSFLHLCLQLYFLAFNSTLQLINWEFWPEKPQNNKDRSIGVQEAWKRMKKG